MLGNSAKGLDFPTLNTDIKVTSVNHPQSSCPYRNLWQKVYGLGYNLLIFVYSKQDDTVLRQGFIRIQACRFISASRTADYRLTKELRAMCAAGAGMAAITALLQAYELPGTPQ